MSTPPLLALPGELRNRIYEFCVEPKYLYIRRHPKRTKKHYAYARCGLYGSLRNACRQTRAEFGSMYMAKTVMVVHQITANSFLKTFYPELRQPTLAREESQSRRSTDMLPASRTNAIPGVQGNILIISYFGTRFDATQLVRLCTKYPSFKVTFTEASACLRHAALLGDFFTGISSGAFCPDFEHVIKKVEISCSMLPEIRFNFYSGSVMEGAMAQYGTADPRQSLVKMGAPPMNAFAILFAAETESAYKHSAPLL